MKTNRPAVLLFFFSASLSTVSASQDVHGLRNPAVTGRQQVWRTVTITFEGPHTGETAEPNPFTDYRLDEPRKNCLWANLMAGGAGVEWYFGYKFPHNDLHCEDWRSRRTRTKTGWC